MNKMEIDIAHRNFSGLEIIKKSLLMEKCVVRHHQSKFADKNPMNTLHNTP